LSPIYAAFPAHGADSETLLAAADRALYDAKQADRDRIAITEAVKGVSPFTVRKRATSPKSEHYELCRGGLWPPVSD